MSDQTGPIDVVSFDSLQAIFDTEDALLNAPEKPKKITATDRLERSFAEINDFVREHEREPSATTREIAERKLGARLAGIRANPEKVDLLRDLDELGLLDEPEAPASLDDLLSLDSGEGGLGLLDDASGLLDVAALPASRKRPAEAHYVAQRVKCTDFERFEPLFIQKQRELGQGGAKLVPFSGKQTITEGTFFVLGGVMLFIADVGDASFKEVGGKTERRERLRVVFENGTESSMLLKSLSIRMYEQGDGYRVVPATEEALLADDFATGWVYVLRSRSDDPQIAGRENLFKIGFSTTPVEKRIANAVNEPTYLMAPVEIVEAYRTYNLKTSVLEHLLHRVFADARLKINQTGSDGRRYDVTEWFEVPLPAIRQAADLIVSGDIVDYIYEPSQRRLIDRSPAE